MLTFLIFYEIMVLEKRLGIRMNLAEIKNANKNDLLDFLDAYSIEAWPDESIRVLRRKAVDLYWATKENRGYSFEDVQAF